MGALNKGGAGKISKQFSILKREYLENSSTYG